MDKLDKDYVWECDYGIREPLIPILKELLSKQDADSLQMVSLLTNSIPYNLEFYVVVSYDNPQEGHIEFMKNSMLKAGLRYRPDITLNELIKEMGNRRFNAQALVNENDVEAAMNSESLFSYIEKSAMKKLGYVIDGPLGNKMPIFLSYSSKDTTEMGKIDFLCDDIKYLKRKGKSLEEVAKEIIPTLKKYMK